MSSSIQVKHLETSKAAIGKRIRSMRGERTQLWVERQSGVDRSIIAAIETGSRDYRIESLLKVLVAVSDGASPIRFTFLDRKSA